MSDWSGGPRGALLCSEERWLAAVGLLWTPFTGTYTALCQGAGAPAVMWIGSGLMTLYGVWLAVLAPLWIRWRRGRQAYQVDQGGLRVIGPSARRISRRLTHDIARAWLEDGPGKTRQLWVRTQEGSCELWFVGIPAGSEDALTLEAIVSKLHQEA